MVEPSSAPIRFEQWEILLKPISETAPAGKYLQYEKMYDQIKEARREDDPNLPRNEWEKTDLKKADWSQVQALCLEALSNQTKDLQIVVWLTEALLHLHGYKGLKTGLQLLIQLCERYWNHLYPPVEEDIEYRIAPLSWLNHDNFIRQLGTVPITAPNSHDTVPYTFIHWQGVQSLETKPIPQKEAAVAEGKPTHSQFLISATLTAHSFYTSLIGDLQESIDSLELFNQMLDDLCGPAAPSLGKFRQTLIDIQHVVNVILVDRPQTSVQELEITKSNLDSPSETETLEEQQDSFKVISPIRSRREAYQRLAEAAEYLERTEPHSPAPYLVKRAISWGNMPLNQLLAEIVNDDKDLTAIYTLLGIQDKASGKK